jgi:hypothetical protein
MNLEAFLSLRETTLTSADKSAWRSFANRKYHIGWFSVGAEDEQYALFAHRRIVRFDEIPLCIRYGFQPSHIQQAWADKIPGSRHCKYYLQDADGDIHCAG